MSIERDIATALQTRFNALAQTFSPSVPIQLKPDGTAFTPPQNGRWIRLSHLNGDPFGMSLPAGGSSRHAGIFQIDVFDPVSAQNQMPPAIVQDIADHFPRGQRMHSETVTVTVEQEPSVPLNPMRDSQGPWFMWPIRVRWFCYARRS